MAQHAHTCLVLEKSFKTLDNSANYIQYANELWTSIVFLSKTIGVKARATFLDLQLCATPKLLDSISAIYLLENTSINQIFEEFLSSRTVNKLTNLTFQLKLYSFLYLAFNQPGTKR